MTTTPAELRGLPDVSILYDKPTDDGIGPLGSVLVDLAGSLGVDGSTVTFELDDQCWWTVALEPFRLGDAPEIHDQLFLTGDLDDPDLLRAIETARAGLATFSDEAGRRLNQTRYDLGAHAERERLYRRVRAAVERAAKHPRRCQETVEGRHFELPPIPVS